VGGFCRDLILGKIPKDKDFVVCGATPQDLLDLKFQQVGCDFPVFLHPRTSDEFALARLERKIGSGYHGFETDHRPTVTLEEDLFRRDLTCNSIAMEVDPVILTTGEFKTVGDFIDPYNGQQDLRDGILRHVSEAFSEDPTRVLRVCRFRARYGFDIAPETMELMKQLVNAGELNHLTPERVWAETEKALMEDRPSLFFHTLMECGATKVLMPELRRSIISTGLALNRTALWGLGLEHRVLVLVSEMSPDETNNMLVRLKASSKIIRDATCFCEVRVGIENNPTWTAESIMELFTRINVWRSGRLLRKMNVVLASTFRMRSIVGMDVLTQAYFRTRDVRFASLSSEQQKTLKGKEVGQAIYDERLRLIREMTGILRK